MSFVEQHQALAGNQDELAQERFAQLLREKPLFMYPELLPAPMDDSVNTLVCAFHNYFPTSPPGSIFMYDGLTGLDKLADMQEIKDESPALRIFDTRAHLLPERLWTQSPIVTALYALVAYKRDVLDKTTSQDKVITHRSPFGVLVLAYSAYVTKFPHITWVSRRNNFLVLVNILMSLFYKLHHNINRRPPTIFIFYPDEEVNDTHTPETCRYFKDLVLLFPNLFKQVKGSFYGVNIQTVLNSPAM
jgi:hypothetical protein